MKSVTLKTMPDNFRRCLDRGVKKDLGKHGLTITELDAKAADRLERETHAKIADYLRMRGIEFGHARMDRKSTYTVGWPDFSFVIGGQACFLEVKRAGENPDPDQERCLDNLSAAGAFCLVVFTLAQAIEAVKLCETKRTKPLGATPTVHPTGAISESCSAPKDSSSSRSTS